MNGEVALPPTPNDLQRPEWVMLGVRQGHRHVIYASQTLTAAAMEATIRDREVPITHPLQRVPSSISYSLGANMASIVMAEGDTYAEALHRLLEFWSPDDTTRPAGIAAAVDARRALGR